MIAARKMLEKMREEVAKLPIKGNTTLSQPVIRVENGRVCIACIPIVIPDTLKDTDMMPRPQLYILYELDGTGFCNPKAMPFTEALFQGQFSNNRYYGYRPKPLPESVYDELYLSLDSARQSLLENPDSTIYREAYDRYLAALCTTVPKDMQRLYRLLSNPPESKDATLEAPKNDLNNEKQEDVKQEMDIPKEDRPQIIETADQGKENLVWTPQINLSTMPEMTYRMHERIAEQIEFLENKTPGQFRIAYPLYCFPKDRKMSGGAYQELLYSLKSGQMPKGHMRIAPKASIYAKCANAKDGCMFSSCPYIIAAYIRYLKDNDPDELQRQRELYKKKEETVNSRYLKTLPFVIGHPAKSSASAMNAVSEGIKLMQTGCIEFGSDGDKLQVTWRPNENFSPVTVSILREQLSDWHDDMNIVDTEGNPVPQEVYGAILAYDTASRSSARLVGASVKETVAEEKAPVSSPETPKETKKQASSQPQKKEVSLEDYMPKNGPMYRCLTDERIKVIYGTYETPVPVSENDGFVKAVMEAMKAKGVTELEILKGTSNSIPRAGKLCFVNLNGHTEFKTAYFNAKSSVILCGKPTDIQAAILYSAAEGIYGHLSAKKPEREFRSLYDRVMKLLPDELKTKAQNTTPADLIRWMYEDCMPRTEDNNIAEYIAWRCLIEDEIVFGEGKETNEK